MHLPRFEIISQKDDLTIFVWLMGTPLLLGGQAKILGATPLRTGIGKSGKNRKNLRKDLKNMEEEKHLLAV